MSNEIYFCGYRVEHFTGWGGNGHPIFVSANKNGAIVTNTSSILWGDIKSYDTGQDVYFSFVVGSWAGYETSVTITDGSNCIVINNQDNGNYTFTTYCYYGTYSNNKLTFGNLLFESSPYSVDANHYQYSLKLSSWNNGYQTMIMYVSQAISTNFLSPILIYDGKITNDIQNITSIFSTTSNNGRLYYVISSNFDLLNSYLDYTTISSPGYTSQWSGNTNTFQTYPISYTASGGYSSSTNNTSQSYTLTRTLKSVNTATTIPLALITSSNDIATNSSGIISPYFTNGTNSITTSNTSSVTTSGNTSNFYFYQNPLTNKNWTTNDINNIQVGLTKIS